MFAESSASDLFRKFMGNETNCSTNQMARKTMKVNKNYLFKGSSSQLNNHSAMAVGKFILALSVQFEFCFILRLFAL